MYYEKKKMVFFSLFFSELFNMRDCMLYCFRNVIYN